MRDQQQMMIERQAELISKLNKDVKEISQALGKAEIRLSERDHYAEQYQKLIVEISSSDIIKGEWVRFCSFLKMGASEKYLKDVGEES